MTDLTARSSRVLGCAALAAVLFALVLASPLYAVNLATNESFETPVYSNPSHNYWQSDGAGGYINLTGTAWTHTGRSGIGRGNKFGAAGPNCAPADGAQMAFLQGDAANSYTPGPSGVSSLRQDVSGFVVGEAYTVSFDAMAINGYSFANPFYVSLGGTDLFGLVTPVFTYTRYTSAPITATAETMNLLFYDQGAEFTGGAPSGQVSWIDDVQVCPYFESLVSNGGFETPIFAQNSHNYQIGIAGSGWTPTGRATIDRGNAYGGSVTNATAFEGRQMGCLQGDKNNFYTPAPDGVSSLQQDVSGFVVGGQYVLSFEAKGLTGSYEGEDPFYASIGGIDLFGLITPDVEYEHYSAAFTATAETMSLRFYDAGNVSGGRVSWIDDVRISQVPEPGTVALVVAGSLAALALASWRRNRRT